MMKVDEKEILEIEKLKLEVSKYLKEGNLNILLKFYSAMLATIAISIIATRYFTGA